VYVTSFGGFKPVLDGGLSILTGPQKIKTRGMKLSEWRETSVAFIGIRLLERGGRAWARFRTLGVSWEMGWSRKRKIEKTTFEGERYACYSKTLQTPGSGGTVTDRRLESTS